MPTPLSFFLNGQHIELENPPPDLLLLDFLRSPEIGLIGPKKGCGQGGCGACTVILSHWDAKNETVEHRAVNSCLRPVCALQGMAVTTIEGTGSVVPVTVGNGKDFTPSFSRAGIPLTRMSHESRQQIMASVAAASTGEAEFDPVCRVSLVADCSQCGDDGESLVPKGTNPVAYRLAANNGTQCGYCSVGFVMAMSGFLLNKPNPTQREIEDNFDGNICRCTGYRPILTAMKTFASDWTSEDQDELNASKLKLDPAYDTQTVLPKVVIPFPDAAKIPPPALDTGNPRQTWIAVDSIDGLVMQVRQLKGKPFRLVHGNTAYGVYPTEFETAPILLDIRPIAELYAKQYQAGKLVLGAGISYSDLIGYLDEITPANTPDESTRIGALHFMARRTAGTLVRNAASLGGNTAIVLQHIHDGLPFPSDLFTVLSALNAQIELVDLHNGQCHSLSVWDLIKSACKDSQWTANQLIVNYTVDCNVTDEIVLAQKVALREVNSHTIVNVTTAFSFSSGTTLSQVVLTYGGIAPYPWRATRTEDQMKGKALTLDKVSQWAQMLAEETRAELSRWTQRMKSIPDEGFTDAYRVDLVTGFFYKAIINALLQRNPESVPKSEHSAGAVTWGQWPVSKGHQYSVTQKWKAPVSESYIKLLALYQTSGQVHYTHEIAIPPTGLNAALVQSHRALASFSWMSPDGTESDREGLCRYLKSQFNGFVDLLTDQQIPQGGANLQGMGQDQPLFANGKVMYVGQSLALVLAKTERQAQTIAEYVGKTCVHYKGLDWPAPWNEPVLTIERALEIGSIFPDYPQSAPFVSHIWRIVRPNSRLDWVDGQRSPLSREIVSRHASVDGVACLVIENTQEVGGHAHFYMETHACVAYPEDDSRMVVHPSTQSPMEMHQTSARALGVAQNRVRVQVRPVGGGFGGKTEQARFITGPTVVASYLRDAHVRLIMKREADTTMVGKRHPFYGQCQIALDTGATVPEDRGLIRGFDVKMWGDGGAFYDCSFIVTNCMMLRADNAYRVPNSRMQIDVCRTNKAPNTAFRAFGDIQSKLITENAIDDAAFMLGMSAEAVREKNLYQIGDSTPFGQALTYCYIREVWDYLKDTCQFEQKQVEIAAFNAANRWTKRGMAMIPVKYGSGYNLLMLEQAQAMVCVYSADGTILIHQGGVDMGQGLTTYIAQIAAYVLNVPIALIRVENTDTGIVPNPSSTGASTGTIYNGEAVKRACVQLRQRLLDFGYGLKEEYGESWCREQGVDFWNYGEKGWASKIDDGSSKLIWQNLITLAYQSRINLVSQFQAQIRGGEAELSTLEFKPQDLQPEIPGITSVNGEPGVYDSFVGYTYSAACAVVEVDILTGETTILSADVMYDMGWSLNPALDIGQVEGAFVQGIGYVKSEKLVYEPDGENHGRLNSDNTWTYKPPAYINIPQQFNVHLFPRNLAKVPENPTELLSSKEVGEPPLVLASTVFFAIKQAIRASRIERGLNGLFRLECPATVQEVRTACEVTEEDLGKAGQSH